MGFRCVYSIKSSVFRQNYCISRINLCGHTTSPAGTLGGATDDNDGNKISGIKKAKGLIHYQTKTLNMQLAHFWASCFAFNAH